MSVAIPNPYQTHTRPISASLQARALGQLTDNTSKNGVFARFGH